MSYPYGRGTLPSRLERLDLLRAYDRAYHEFVRRGEITRVSWETWMGFNLYGGLMLKFGAGRRGKWWVE